MYTNPKIKVYNPMSDFTEIKETSTLEKCNSALTISLSQEEDEEEMREMWLEKMSRPGRLAARQGLQYSEKEMDELIRQADKDERDCAMMIIQMMSAREFQEKLLDRTLPSFKRAQPNDIDYPRGLQRDTCHPKCLLHESDFGLEFSNYGGYHRDKLRYMEIDEFKAYCYQEFEDKGFEDKGVEDKGVEDKEFYSST